MSIKLLKFISNNHWDTVYKVKVGNKTLDSTKRILKDYIRYTIGNSPKSEYFMDEIIQKEKNRL